MRKFFNYYFGTVLAALLGLFAGVSAYTFYYAKGYSYLSNDPTACTNCHVMREQFDGWQKATHHAFATCNDCHVPQTLAMKYYTKAEHGYRHSAAFTLMNFHEPIEMKSSSTNVVLHNCVRCHSGLIRELHPGTNKPNEQLDCLNCHRSVGHGPTK